MSIFFDENNATSVLSGKSLGSRTGFAENVRASFESAAATQAPTAKRTITAEAYDDIIGQLNDGTPERKQFANPLIRSLNDAHLYGPTLRRSFTADELEGRIWTEIDRRRQVEPGFMSGAPTNREEFHAKIEADRLKADKVGRDVGSRAAGMGHVGTILGMGGGIMADPQTFAGIAATAQIGFASTITRTMLQEAAIGGILESILQPDVMAERRDLGLEYTARDFLMNVGSATVFSGAFGALLKGSPKAFQSTRGAIEKKFAPGRAIGREMLKALDEADPGRLNEILLRANRRDLADIFDATVNNPTAEQAAARGALEREIETVESNPLEDTPEGRAEHAQRLEAGEEAAIYGIEPKIADRPSAAALAPLEDNLDGLVFRFRPEEVEVDAAVFQFKEGGDVAGVTERLEGVTKWDPIKAGQVLVYEFEDGRRFIADGHQRLALAKRLSDEGRDIKIYGQLIREVDGISPQEIRVIAAMKNISEGTGTAIDAAKVLRVSPDRLPDLPPRSNLVRQAQHLVNLSDHAFGYVVNEIVPAHYASIVGRLVEDPELQEAVLNVLAKTDPANATQAEAVVRQALAAGADRRVEATLFGEEVVLESYYTERAKVLDRTIKQLKKDRAVFNTLARNRQQIEAEGNVLSADTNLRRAEQDAVAIQTLQTLANRKGPLSDALTEAGKRARKEGRYDRAVGEFSDAVRSSVERGDFEGATIGGDVRDLDVTPEVRGRAEGEITPTQEQASLQGFAEPASDTGEAQLQEILRRLQNDIENPDVARTGPTEIDDMNFTHPDTGEGIVQALERAGREFDELGSTHAIRPDEPVNFEGVDMTRGAMREEIGARIYGEGALRKERTVDIIMGVPASGKSSLIELGGLRADRGALLIDADDAKAMLPEFDNGFGANRVHDESAAIVEGAVMPRALMAGDNVVWPIVGKTEKGVLDKIALFKEHGYTVNVHYMHLDEKIATWRSLDRFNSAGRLLDPQYVFAVNGGPLKVFNKIKGRREIDGWAHYDNDVSFGEKPRLLETSSEGSFARYGQDRGGLGRRDPRGVEETPEIPKLKEAVEEVDFEVPVGRTFDENGDEVVVVISSRDLVEDIKRDEAFLSALEECA